MLNDLTTNQFHNNLKIIYVENAGLYVELEHFFIFMNV